MHRDRGKKEFGCEAIWKRSRVESRARTTQTPQAIRSRAFVSGQLRERERESRNLILQRRQSFPAQNKAPRLKFLHPRQSLGGAIGSAKREIGTSRARRPGTRERALIIYSRYSRAASEKVWRLFSPPVNAISWNGGENSRARRRFSAAQSTLKERHSGGRSFGSTKVKS
jgi:hypothetical protein